MKHSGKPPSRHAPLFSESASAARPRGMVIASIDGGARGNPGPAAYGFLLRDAGGATLVATGKTVGHATNNVAEYFGLIAALDAARERGVASLRVESDSELLVRQMEGRYRVKSPDLRPLHERAVILSRSFEHFEIAHVPREKNREADRLVNEALDGGNIENRPGRPPQLRTVRARYQRGVFVPEEAMDLPDGAEFVLTVRPAPPRRG